MLKLSRLFRFVKIILLYLIIETIFISHIESQESKFMDENPKIQELLERELPSIRTGNPEERNNALGKLKFGLMTLGNTWPGRIFPNQKTKEIMSKELIDIIETLKGKDEITKMSRLYIIDILTKHGGDLLSTKYILNIFKEGPNELRERALSRLGSPHGVYGDEVFNEVKKLCDKGIIPEEEHAIYLDRASREKGLPEVLNILKTTKNRKAFVNASKSLRDYKYLPYVFERIKEFKLDEPNTEFPSVNSKFSPDVSSCIDRKKLNQFIEQSDGEDLIMALEVINMSSSFMTDEIVPILLKKIEHANPKVREMCINPLLIGSQHPNIDQQQIVNILEKITEKENVLKIKEKMIETTIKIKEFMLENDKRKNKGKKEPK
ncbi:MAG: hypothetical protein WC955_12725 [Elusimicrobiota bacterium]